MSSMDWYVFFFFLLGTFATVFLLFYAHAGAASLMTNFSHTFALLLLQDKHKTSSCFFFSYYFF